MAALREIIASFVVGFDGSALEKGDGLVGQMVDKLKGFGKVVAGAFALDAIARFTGELINEADALREAAIGLGLGARQLQELEHAAELSGVGVEQLRASLARLQKGAAEAAAGKGPAEAFKKLGVELKNADGTLKTSGDLFEEAGVAISKIENPTERAGIASQIFGKQYAKLLPLFAEGEEGIKKLKAEVQDLGFGFDDAFLEQADEFNDNLSRLKKGFKGLAIQAIAPLLPDLVALAQHGVRLTKQFVGWIRHTKLVQAVLIGLSAKGVLALVRAVPLLIAKLGGLRVVLATLGRFILRTLLPFLILEDILVFLAGGDSALGRTLDAAFGTGTQEQIRALLGELLGFFKAFKSNPDEVRKAFATLPQDLEKDLGGFGKFLGEWGQQIVEFWLFVTNALTGGWQNFVDKMTAAADGILLALKIVWTEVKFGFLAAAAAISDAFGGIWNSVIASAQQALDTIGRLLAAIPGMGGVRESIDSAIKSLGGNKVDVTAGDQIRELRDKARLVIADEGDRIGARLTATAPVGPAVNQNVNQTTTVNVTVPPGTPEQTARAVGRAAERGAQRGTNLRATHAALVPTAG